MRQKGELWTTYAQRRFEEAGVQFGGWGSMDTGDTGVDIVNRGTKGENLVVVLEQVYSWKAFDLLVKFGKHSDFSPNEVEESLSLSNNNTSLDFYFGISSNGKIKVEEFSNVPGKLLPRRKDVQFNVEPLLERMIKYVRQYSSE